MVKVECEGCRAPYQVDERRIPAAGLKMRCPRCGTSFVVHGAATAAPDTDSGSDLPTALPVPAGAPPRPAVTRPGAPPPPPPRPPPRPPPPASPDLAATQPQRSAHDVQTVPRRAARPVADDMEIDLPSAVSHSRDDSLSDLPATRSMPQRPFGEIDLMVDLPAPSSPPPGSDAPGVQDDLPVVHGGRSRAGTQPGFGEIDLPSVAGPVLDLPVPVAARQPLRAQARTQQGLAPPSAPPAEFGEIELPLGEAALPALADRSPALPSVARGPQPGQPPPRGAPTGAARGPEAGLPALARPPVQAIAPSPQQPVARRAPTAPFGEIDLPLVSPDDDRPAELPSAVAPGLPVMASPSLPSATGVGLPSQTGVGLPSAVAVGLPTAVGGVGMPMPATSVGMPSPATAVGMPSPATALGMPEAAMGSGVPMAAGGPGLPSAVDAGLPMNAELGVELYGGHPAGGDLDIGAEISLGSGYPHAGPTGGGGGAGAVGEGIELATDAAVVSQRQQTARAPIVEIAPARRRPVRRYVLAFVVLAAIGGGSLALLPDVGPFGFNKATDVLNAPKHAAALVEIRRDAQQELEADTAAAAARALGRARAAQESAPRHRPTAAYAAYLAFASNVRFGKKPQDDAYAKEMVAKAEQAATTPEAMLAAAAQDTSGGQLARARQALGNLSTTAPGDIDAAVLAGELELIAKAPDKAVPAWKQAVAIKKSARTLFGLARAQVAAGEIAGAEESAKAVLAASPLHAGARTLLAQIAWPKPEREAESVELVTKVTSEGDVRAAASPGELVDAYTVLGRIHLARSRISAAEQAFGAALKLDPQAVQALLGNGELFYGSGRYSEALARFEAAIGADADSVAAVVGRGKTLLALERMKEAKDLLFALRQKKPKEPAIAYWLGRTEEALGNKKAAEAAYLDTVKIGGDRPEIVDAYVALSNLLSSIGRGDDAAAKLTEASKQFPDSPALHRAKGEVALAAGRYDEAKKEFEAALGSEDNLATRFKLGQVYRRMRQFDAAVTVFDGITAVDKEFPGLALERGILFEETGQTEKALEMYNSALQKAPNDIDLLLRVGSTMVMAGQVKEAEPILRKVVTQRPTAEAYHFLGRALLLKGSNLTEAMRYLERGVEGDPNRAEYWLYVGWAANETGNPARAEETLKKALELDQNNGDAYWQRAVLRQKQSACLDALDDVKKALEKRPSRYEAYSTMARCLSEQSRWGETIEAWRKAIAGNDKVPEWHYRLGKVYESSGNRGAAHAELRRALELLDPAVEKQTSWAADAHRLAGESWQVSNPEQAEKHFRRYLELAPSEDAGYRREIERWLEQRRGAN